jgi:PAS domain S-box-containing protein
LPSQPGGARVRVDVELANFNRHFARMNSAGQTGEACLCFAQGATMRCFPSRLRPAPMTLPMTRGARRLPEQLALEGATGVANTRDYRGAEVLAAYGTIGGTGLGLVQTVDTEEFFRPLRERLLAALAGMTLLILGGASLLQWRTQPLVLGLVRTRARLDAILNNVPAGVLTFDQDGVILSSNRGACLMFGYRADKMTGRPIHQLIEGGNALLGEGLRGVRQLRGRRRTGAALALEVVAGEFMLGERKRRIAIVQDVGERIQMEQALRQREASLAHAQQLAHIGSWELDLRSGSYYWSDETFRIFGRTPGGVPPDHGAVMEAVHPDDRAHKLQAEDDAIAGRRPYDVTFRVVLASGEVKMIHSRAETGFDGAGAALRLRGTIQDITEKTWADEQLRKREEEYRALVENSPDVVIRFDRSLRCVYVNPALATAPGLRPVIGYGRVLGDGDKRAAVPWAQAVRKALAGGKPDAFEVAVDANGALCHYQVQVVPEVRQGAMVAAVLATARDITAIRSGEAVLRESEQRLAGIAANTPGAVFQCVSSAGELSFTYLSEGIVPLFGERPAAVLADPGRLTSRISAADRPGFFASLARSARTLKMLNWEGRALSGDGREIWVNCRATPRMAGAATVWEGLMLNITDSKRNERQLTESRQLLRELSAHREHVREEERKKIAREVHDELGQALTALRMDVALLRMAGGPHSEALLARIQSMKAAVDRTIGIVRNVTSALRPAALDVGLNAALEWQVDEFMRCSGIECVLHAIDEVELEDAQATALFRIVQESLTNVLKHARATHVEVSLEVLEDRIRLEISDNGCGFAAGEQPQRGKFGLMGMRERALMLGGRAEINSAAGHGATIQVSLPRTRSKDAPALYENERHDG